MNALHLEPEHEMLRDQLRRFVEDEIKPKAAAWEETGAVPPDLWPVFEAAAAVPMLVIRGELSDILAADCVTRMGERDPDLETVEVPRVGHAPMLTEPEALRAIDAFLGRLG